MKRSRIVRLVSEPTIGKLVSELESRSRILKLLAASRPSTLWIWRPPALKLVRLSKSCAVNGPVGFPSVARIAASRPASGTDRLCANVEVVKPVRLSVAKIEKTVRAIRVEVLIVVV